jgi:hypothetical protein
MARILESQEEIALNLIIRHISIAYSVEFMDSVLRIEVGEDKLLELAKKIVESLPPAIKNYTGSQQKVEVDRLHIKIGEYNLKAKWIEKKEQHTVVTERGFKKENNGK